jgi:branched-chain amino acid transport system permease protein
LKNGTLVRLSLILVASILLLIAPAFLRQYLVSLVFITLFYAVLGEAWNLIGGFAGQLSLGNTVFLGIGAYFSMLLYLRTGMSPIIGMLLGAGVSAAIAVGFGMLTIRLRGNYFSMATLGLTEVTLLIAQAWVSVTGGQAGIAVIPKNSPMDLMFTNYDGYYYIMLGLLALTIGVTVLLLRSTHGYHLRAIGNDETLAESLGINTTREKVLAFVISAVLTSAAGSVYVFYVRFITPAALFEPQLSLQIVLMPVIGGLGTLLGPLVGAAVFIPVQNFTITYLGPATGSLDLVGYAVILIVVVLFAPNGLVALAARLWRALTGKGTKNSTPVETTVVPAEVILKKKQ